MPTTCQRSPSRAVRPPDARTAPAREDPVKAGPGTVKEPSRPLLTSGYRPYEGLMTDVVYVLVTLAAFVGLALLVGVLDRPGKDRA